MTRREQLERKAERRRQWAVSREAKSEAARAEYQRIGDQIPSGQPILVGHHSEKRHRRDVDRIWSKLGETVEHGRMAERHEQAAAGIERALATSIFSDDEDAVEQLGAKVARLEAERDRMKTANAEYRREHRAELKAMTPYQRSQAVPYASWAITNIGARIRDAKQRAEQIGREQTAREEGRRIGGRAMLAKYGGTCADCGQEIERGQSIVWYRSTREAVHYECPKEES